MHVQSATCRVERWHRAADVHSASPRNSALLFLDIQHAVLDNGLVSLDRDDAGRRHDFAGADVEAALMEVALDDFAVQEAL